MAAEVGIAFLSASLQVLFDRLASEEVLSLFRGEKASVELLEELKIQLISVKKLINDAEEKQLKVKEVAMWLDDLKDVIYQADDLVDKIDSEALKRKVEGESSSTVIKVANDIVTGFHRTVENEATNVLRRLKLLLDQKDALGLREGVEHRLTSQRPSTPLADEQSVYGRKREIEAIVDLLILNESTDKITVIPIVGLGGIGKTTLAQLVYNDESVIKHFGDVRAWVTVSQVFDVCKILKTLLEKVTSKKCEISEDDTFELQSRLKEALKGKKFLFVLDDVWNENYNEWDILHSSFTSAADGSKIIVTARSTSVSFVRAGLPHHELSKLSSEDGWQLFARHAFGNNADPNEYRELQEIGRDIVNKCDGLPLAIKSLGGLLCSERDPGKWEDILKSDVWKNTDVLPALWLSYRHLPTHLKRCFAYCSIFPKKHEFRKDKLVLLWMAEGFLLPTGSKKMEEVGERYFDNLLSGFFFQRSTEDGERILMHDLVHDLAVFIASDFCVQIDCTEDMYKLKSKTRHLLYSRRSDDWFRLEGLSKAKHLRTFVLLRIPRAFTTRLLRHDLLFTNGSFLRVLSLSHSTIKEVPKSVGKLSHLRYLDLSFTKIEKLPDSICTLYNLQTLLLACCRSLTALPEKMENLINLRHLDIKGVPLIEMKMRIRNMKSLQTLSKIVVGDDNTGPKIYELKKVQPCRGRLEISRLENVVSAAEANLKDKKGIVDLQLSWSSEAVNVANTSEGERQVLDSLRPHTDLRYLIIDFYRGTRFSNWICDDSFTNIVSISLWDCKNCLSLPPLGQLPSLKYLFIIGFDSIVSIGDELFGDGHPFKCLETLSFRKMPELREWSFGEGRSFPRLVHFTLSDCPKATPSLVYQLHSKLKRLSLVKCPQLIIQDMDRLSLLGYLHIRELDTDSFPQHGLLLPSSLTRVNLEICSNLETLNDEAFRQLTSLVRLAFSTCPKLRCFPGEGLPASLKHLHVEECDELDVFNGKAFRELTSLERLAIIGCPKLRCLLEEALPASLKSLAIRKCVNFEAFNGKAFRELTSLKTLTIDGCPKFHCFPEEGLPASLKYLKIRECVNFEAFNGENFRELTSLKTLTINGCPKFHCFPEEGLPASLQELTSLRKLKIRNCEKLRCFPEEGPPESLKQIWVKKCPLLKEWCEKDEGNDWNTIAHFLD